MFWDVTQLKDRYDQLVPDRPEGACWLWTGHLMAGGYGRTWFGGKAILATHIALILDGQPRPDPKAHALHSCDNPPCVNPAHLRWGDQRLNNVDRDTRGRQKTLRGSANPRAKLTEADVLAIRQDRRPLRLIAADYGISICVASKVRNGEAWRHVA